MASASGYEPSMKDVMSMLKVINDKIESQQLQPSPPMRLKPHNQERVNDSPPCSPSVEKIRGGGAIDDIPDMPLNGSWASKDVIERVLIPRDKIEKRVRELAKEISRDYPNAEEGTLSLVGLMSGCYMFMADLSRELEVPHTVDFMAVSSYGMEAVSSANVKIKKDLDLPVAGRDVIIVDEMCDTGRTMACLIDWMHDKGAKSVKVAVLLNKAARREVEGLKLDYLGWDCEDEFLVGYGMDWSSRFRSLPDINVVRRSAYAPAAADFCLKETK